MFQKNIQNFEAFLAPSQLFFSSKNIIGVGVCTAESFDAIFDMSYGTESKNWIDFWSEIPPPSCVIMPMLRGLIGLLDHRLFNLITLDGQTILFGDFTGINPRSGRHTRLKFNPLPPPPSPSGLPFRDASSEAVGPGNDNLPPPRLVFFYPPLLKW